VLFYPSVEVWTIYKTDLTKTTVDLQSNGIGPNQFCPLFGPKLITIGGEDSKLAMQNLRWASKNHLKSYFFVNQAAPRFVPTAPAKRPDKRKGCTLSRCAALFIFNLGNESTPSPLLSAKAFRRLYSEQKQPMWQCRSIGQKGQQVEGLSTLLTVMMSSTSPIAFASCLLPLSSPT
jgi:hypothetical protein